MRRFVEGADRGQWTLLPECLDDFIDESNPVRVIDVFVDALDLAKMSLKGLSRRQRVAPVRQMSTAEPYPLGTGFLDAETEPPKSPPETTSWSVPRPIRAETAARPRVRSGDRFAPIRNNSARLQNTAVEVSPSAAKASHSAESD